jgi:hypothetical protein
MPLFGYVTWERFSDAIERAKTTAPNTGVDASDHFASVGDSSGLHLLLRTRMHAQQRAIPLPSDRRAGARRSARTG